MIVDEPLRDHAPWITFRAIGFLESWLNSTMSVHEWGCGGSTIFFAKRCKKVTSVEHVKPWVDRVRSVLGGQKLTNVCMRFMPPNSEPKQNHLDPKHFSSSKIGRELRDYCYAIDGMHDLVLVDGRARNGCVLIGKDHVAHGGFLILDNADRARYARANALMGQLNWERHDWTGLTSYGAGVTTTTMGWRRP